MLNALGAGRPMCIAGWHSTHMKKVGCFKSVFAAAWCLSACMLCVPSTAMAFQKGGSDIDIALNGMLGVLLFSASLFAACCILFSQRRHSARPGGSGGGEAAPPPAGSKPPPPDAGKPVPLKPCPSHHLVAAKDLPPSDKTHCFPKD